MFIFSSKLACLSKTVKVADNNGGAVLVHCVSSFSMLQIRNGLWYKCTNVSTTKHSSLSTQGKNYVGEKFYSTDLQSFLRVSVL
jgi:hypothetical protein